MRYKKIVEQISAGRKFKLTKEFLTEVPGAGITPLPIGTIAYTYGLDSENNILINTFEGEFRLVTLYGWRVEELQSERHLTLIKG